MSANSSTAAAAQVFVRSDSLNSGLVTQTMFDNPTPGLRVTWIYWHSGFRGTGLRVGDFITAINGVAIARPADLSERQRMSSTSVGQYAEYQQWEKRGLAEGSVLRLTVARRAMPEGWETREFSGPLRLLRTYVNANNRSTLGPGGPEESGSDGLYPAWSSWLENFQRFGERVLDRWGQNGFLSTEAMLRELLESEPRLPVLREKYPGPFADAVLEDFATIRVVLEGTNYELTAEDLAFRRLDEERVAEVRGFLETARTELLGRFRAEVLDTLPPLDLLSPQRAELTGKILVLPSITPREWVTESMHNYFATQVGGIWCFVDTESAAAQRMQRATRRYQQFVTPNLREDYAIIGRIGDQPRLVVVNGRGVIGLDLEAIGATVGDRFFVDLTVVQDGRSPFAGEDKVTRSTIALAPPDASPKAVLETFFRALKYADKTEWLALFATWRAGRNDDGPPLYYPHYSRWLDSTWEDARRQLQERVCDIRVVWCDVPRVVIRGDEYPGLPRVEDVRIEVEHVGRRAEGFHGFCTVGLTRVWTLQRVAGGPWRIVTENGI